MAETQAQPGPISAGGVLRVPEVTITQPATRDSISAAERGLQCRFKLESSLCLEFWGRFCLLCGSLPSAKLQGS